MGGRPSWNSPAPHENTLPPSPRRPPYEEDPFLFCGENIQHLLSASSRLYPCNGLQGADTLGTLAHPVTEHASDDPVSRAVSLRIDRELPQFTPYRGHSKI